MYGKWWFNSTHYQPRHVMLISGMLQGLVALLLKESLDSGCVGQNPKGNVCCSCRESNCESAFIQGIVLTELYCSSILDKMSQNSNLKDMIMLVSPCNANLNQTRQFSVLLSLEFHCVVCSVPLGVLKF